MLRCKCEFWSRWSPWKTPAVGATSPTWSHFRGCIRQKKVRDYSSGGVIQLVGFNNLDGVALVGGLFYTMIDDREFADANLLLYLIDLDGWLSFVELEMLHPLLLDFFIDKIERLHLINSVPVSYLNAISALVVKDRTSWQSLQADEIYGVGVVRLVANYQDWLQQRNCDLYGFAL